MKKLLSLILVILMLSSTFFVLPASAKITKPKETTYIASHSVYQNNYGKVYAQGQNLMSETTGGKKTILFRPGSYYIAVRYSFYMIGKQVYYSVYDPKGKGGAAVYLIQLDGTKRTKIINKKVELLGGYDDMIIIRGGCAIVNGKIKKLFSVKQQHGYYEILFNGNIYYANRVYNLDTGKISKFEKRNSSVQCFYSERYQKSPIANNNYMYYMSNNNKLVRMDKQGNQKVVATNIKDVLGANSNKNVIYTKNDKKGVETVYRQDSNGKNYKLTSINDIKKLVANKSNASKSNVQLIDAVFVGYKVCINAFSITENKGLLITVNNRGGNSLKKISTSTGTYSGFSSIATYKSNVHYEMRVTGKESGWLYGFIKAA